jgi:hypothetical protein
MTKKGLFKKYIAAVLLALFTARSAAPLYAAAGTNISESGADKISAAQKLNVSLDDADKETGVTRKSNVLFMIDTSQSTMIFTSWGVQPWVVASGQDNANADYANWDTTEKTFGYTFGDVVDMMADCTYGIGTLPSVQTGTNRAEKNILFGRDVDSGNNYGVKHGSVEADIEAYKDYYHFPFTAPGNPLKAAFAKQTTEYVTNGTDGDRGTPKTSDAYTSLKSGKAFPYALVFRNPKYWESGWTETRLPTSLDLVPNDSRMYKTKLVLWRILEDTKLFENIRFGMASVFASNSGSAPTTGAVTNDSNGTGFVGLRHFKHAPFTSGVSDTSSNRVSKSISKGAFFVNGVIQRDGTGQPNDGVDNMYGVQASPWGTGNTSALYKDNDQYRQMNRAHLKLPIAEYGKTWSKGNESITHADKFRLWIDGLNDVAKGTFYTHKNPELIPSGNFQLAAAIFPDPKSPYPMRRDDYIKDKRLWYAYKNDYQWRGNNGNTEHRYTGGSGEASGTVLDFFSPPVNDNTFKGYVNVDNMDDISFPIRDACEDNWVVLLTSGIEVKTNNNVYVYKVRDAIRDLYNHTRDNSVTMLSYNGDKRELKRTELNRPIRTLVVGMVADDAPTAGRQKQIKELHDNLWKMAWAGQGVLPDNADNMTESQMRELRTKYPDIKPLFASDVAGMLNALREALTYINDNQRQPEKGSMTETSPITNEDGSPVTEEDFNLFASTYRVRNFNQWEATLTRYSTKKDENGGIIPKVKWEFSDRLKRQRGQRKLVYWDPAEKKFTEFRADNGKFAKFAKLTGMNNVTQITKGGESIGNRQKASSSLYDWLQGYDYSYTANNGMGRKFDRNNMLSDFGQSGVAFADRPTEVNSLPGYKEWANGKQTVKPMLYAQTNDGILHVINPSSGYEEMAVLPPPALLPSRLATLKTSVSVKDGQSLEWMEVEGEENVKDITSNDHRSKPVYLLDGALQVRRFDIGGWNTYLLGALGRGGKGLYMLDLANYGDPKLMWYWEKYGGGLVHMTGDDGEPRLLDRDGDLSALPGLSDSQRLTTWRGYGKMGFNSPKPAMGAAGDNLNFIALAGGARSYADAANLEEGAALLIIDPKDGHVERVFDSAALLSDRGKWGGSANNWLANMGMMVSQPALYRSDKSQYLTGQIFAADGWGNIFQIFCETNDEGTIKAYDSLNKWTIRTVATLRNGNKPNGGENYAIPHGVVLGVAKSSLWAAGGTADVRVLKYDGLNDEENGVIKNTSQMIFAFSASAKNNGTLYRAGNTNRADDWVNINPDNNAEPKNASGWYIPLQPDDGKYYAEYTSARPLLIDGTLFITTFRQLKIDTNNVLAKCASRQMDGLSRFYVIDVTNARGNMLKDGAKYEEFKGIKFTGLTDSKRGGRRVALATYDSLLGNGNKAGSNFRDDEMTKSKYLILPQRDILGLSDGQSVIDYWLEK